MTMSKSRIMEDHGTLLYNFVVVRYLNPCFDWSIKLIRLVCWESTITVDTKYFNISCKNVKKYMRSVDNESR